MALTRNTYQRNTSWNAPYTFSGKEKDVETGYGFVKKLRFFSSLAFGNEKQVFHYAHCLRRFGARYYDSGLSIWLSVDPMSDKYPSMSPYNYCANNPVILVDPDGKHFILSFYIRDGKNYITLSQTIYTIDQAAYNSVIPAVEQLKAMNGTVVKIDNIEYTINFDIIVVEPANTPYQSVQNYTTETSPGKNIYYGTIDNYDWSTTTTMGSAYNGCIIQMNHFIFQDEFQNVVKGGDFPDLVNHELLHLYGLNDRRKGPYYDGYGRMAYSATASNNYTLYPISYNDIVNILKYAQARLTANGDGAAKVHVSTPNPITETSTIE